MQCTSMRHSSVSTGRIQSERTVSLSAGVSLQGKAVVSELSKKAHLMIGPWSDCVKKEVPWNPSVTISHNQIIISGARKNRRTSTARAPLSNMHNCNSLNGPALALTIDFCHFLTLLMRCKIGGSHQQIGSMMVASWRICLFTQELELSLSELYIFVQFSFVLYCKGSIDL